MYGLFDTMITKAPSMSDPSGDRLVDAFWS
jgi:hypothetical protein